MAKYSQVVSYNIQTTLDASGIAKLQAEIRNVETELVRMANQNLISNSSMQDASNKLRQLRTQISSAFNANLGMLDTKKFTDGLKSANLSLVDLQGAFKTAGTVGEAAFVNTLGRLGKLDTGIKSVSRTTEKLFNTIGNTVRWGVVASGFQTILNSAHQTVQYVRDLDTSLTNIMMVTQQSKEQMNEFAQSANDAAKALSSTTVNMTDAALVFAQQGFDTEMSSALAERSTQLANISQQDTPTTSDQITTIMNAYDFTGDLEQIDAAMDSWANVANVSAADVEELATAAQKAASTANTTGVSFDQLNAQIATIESVTREAPENIGNALKTIYSRFADISMGNTLDDGVNLGNIAETLGKVGVEVLNDEGRMNNVGDIMEQLMEVWGTLDQTQQNAISTVIAGRYQLSRFQALMNRSDLYQDYLGASENAEGTADQMQEIYANSMEGRLNKLQATAEGVFNDIFNTDDFYGMIDALTTILDLTNQWVNAIGGGGTALQGLGAIATRVFSDNIAQSIGNFVQNRNVSKQQRQNRNNALNQLQQAGLNDVDAGRHQSTIDFIEKGLANASKMSTEQQEAYNKAVETTISLKQKQAAQENEILQTQILMDATASAALEEEDSKNLMTSEQDKKAGVLTVDSSGLEGIVPETMEKLQLMREDVAEELSNKSRVASSDLQRLKEELKTLGAEGGTSIQQLGVAIANFENDAARVSKLFADETQTSKELESQLDQLTRTFVSLQKANGTEQQEEAMKEFSKAIDSALIKMQQLHAAAKEGQLMDVDTLYEKRNTLADTDEKINLQQEVNTGFTEGLDFQTNISSIVNATGAVGQLIFSWQSFQSLGSLWSNADTTFGEKLSQTIMNLAINLPMLISGYAELKSLDIGKAFSDFAESLKIADKETKIATASTVALTAAETANATAGRAAASSSLILTVRNTALGAASSVAAGGVKLLGTAINWLASGPGMIALLAITGLSTAISALEQQHTQKVQDIADQAAEADSNLSSLTTSVNDFKTAYELYEGGDTSALESLQSSAESLNGLLDDQQLKVYAAADAWDLYRQRLEQVSQTMIDENVQKITNQSVSARDELSNAMIGNVELTSIIGGEGAILNKNSTAKTRLENETSSITGGIIGFNFTANSDIDTRLRDTDTMVSIYEEEISKTKERLEAVEKGTEIYASINEQLASLEREYSWAQNLQNSFSEERSAYESGLDSRVNAELLQNQNQEQYQYQNNGLDEYRTQLKETDMYASWLKDFGESTANDMLESFIAGMTSVDVEGSAQLAEASAAEQAQLGISQRAYQLAEAEGIDPDKYADEIYQKIENSNISDEDLIKLKASIDTDQLIQNVDDIITSLNSGEEIESIILHYQIEGKYGPSSNFLDDSEISSLAEELDVTTDDFENYQEALIGSNDTFKDYSNRLDENTKSLKKQQEQLEEGTPEYEEIEKEIEDNEQALDSMTALLYESAAGAEELSSVFDDAAEVLRDSSSSTYEQMGAVDSLVPGLEHLLNLDMSSWSEDMKMDFVKQNLNDIQAAINGDTYALQRLRGEAAQQILIQAGIDENTYPKIWTQMSGLIDWANANLPDLRAGASIDDTTFIAQLNNMLASTVAAGGDITAILEGLSELGIDAHVKYKDVSVKVPKIDLQGKIGNVGNALRDAFTGVTYTNQNMSIPYVEMGDLTYRGASSGYAPSSPVGGRSGGSGGSRGGGGGGGGSSYTPQTKDPIEDELDRYERVNTMLEDAENRYERLNADRERLTGFDMADAMEEEVDLLNRQIALHKEKLEIQKEEAQELRDELSSQYGITFDAEGFILNYATTHERLVNEVNSLISQYNTTTTEEGQKALEEQIEDAEDALDNFNETYQRYDELWAGDMQETLNTLEDLEDQIEDIRIEMMNTSIEAVDNLQDLQESLNEFNNTFEHFGEDTGLRDAELAASNLATYFDIANESASALYDTLIQRANDRLNSGILSDDERQRIQQDIAMWENARKQIGAGSMEAGGTGLFDMAFNNLRIMQEQVRQYESTGTSTIFGENSADLYDAANEAYDQATSLLSDFEDEYENLHDAILDMIDEVAEKIEDRREQYENITDELDHQREIIELIHGDEAYDQINMVLDAQNKNYVASINEMQQTLDYWKEMLTHMEEGSEEWKAINEQIMDTQSELNDLVEESLDNLQEKYENTVNNILNQWTSNAFGGTDLDWVAEEWELINRNADYYLDDVNAAYETQKLQGKYLEMLDQTDDLHIQQMITEQMKQQLGYLRDKEKLSEYDVAYANAQLEILQKRIALEEAQRNKSQMQLRRDSQGNYSYVYTADEGDVAAAEGDLLDAQNNAYNLSKEQMKQTQDDSLSALQDAQQLLSDIWTNANLTLDEKTARTQTVIDSLKEYLNATSEQLSESEKNIINDFIGMAEMMTDENGDRISEVLEEVKNGNLEAFDLIDDRWSTALSNWLYNLDEFNMSTDDSFSQLIENSVEFQDNIDAIAGEVNQDFSDMGDTISGVVDQTNDLSSATADFINQLKSDSGVILEYENQLESMREKIADTTNEMRAYQQQVNQLQADLTAKEQENANLSAEIETLRKENESLKNPGGSGGSGGGSFGGSGYSQNDLAWGIAQNIWTYGTAGGWGNDPTRSGKLKGAYGSDFARQVQNLINQNWRSGSLVNFGSDKFSSYSLIGYDTGGYTGTWSDGEESANNGKLAYLHQKELVLNNTDTENILKAVDLVRQITQALKDSAITDVFTNIVKGTVSQVPNDTVEQTVHITAEFPAANSAAEIESALLSLNERAIQYSFKKK